MSALSQVQMAEQEIEALTNMFNGMIQSCYKKCIPAKYTDGELTKGESVCLDRCAAKYIEVSEKIGQQMQQMQQAGVPQ